MLFALPLLLLAQPNLPSLEKACDAKKLSACRELAGFHLEPGHRDERRAYAALDAACQLKDPVSCNALGVLLSNAQTLARDPAEQERVLRFACDAGLAVACLNATLPVLDRGDDAAPLLTRAYSLSSSACAAGDATSCKVQYQTALRLDPPPMSDAERSVFVTRACNRGADWACGALAVQYWSGTGVKADRAEALRLANAACKHREPIACSLVALAALEKKDDSAAFGPATLSCEQEDSLGCMVEGVLVLEGRGGAKKNPARAQELFDRACMRDMMEACQMVLEGFGGQPKLEPRRRERLEAHACARGQVAACKSVAARAAPPAQRAIALERLCETAKDGAACERFAAVLLAGQGVAVDAKRARASRAKACELNHLPACRELLRDTPEGAERRTLIARLCQGGDRQHCAEHLVALRSQTKPPWLDVLFATVRACREGTGCEQLPEVVGRLEGEDREKGLSYLEIVCIDEDQSLPACRAGLALARTLGKRTDNFEWKLCERGDADTCERRAAAHLQKGEHVDGTWFLAHGCRLGRASACKTLASYGQPDLRAMEKNATLTGEQLVQRLLLRRFVQQLGPFPPARVPARTQSLSLAGAPLDLETLKLIRARNLCGAANTAGVSAELLTRKAKVLDAATLPGNAVTNATNFLGALEGDEAAYSLCESQYEFFSIEDQKPISSGPLELEDDLRAFKPIRWTPAAEVARPVAAAPTSTTWEPNGLLGFGAEVVAGLPSGSENFIADTGTLLLRVERSMDRSFDVGARAGVVLPVGASNPFGIVLGVGTVAGVVRAGPVQWRVLTGWVDGWLSFDPVAISVVPALGTQVAFALGRQELSLELGARLPLTLLADDPTLRPRAFQPALFGAVLFRPSF